MNTTNDHDVGLRNGRAVYHMFRGSPWIELATGKAYAGPEGDALFGLDLSDKQDDIEAWCNNMLANIKLQGLEDVLRMK